MSGSQYKAIIIVLSLINLLFLGWILFGFFETQELIIEEPEIPLSQFNPEFNILVASSPGILVESNDRAVIDFSFKHDGYVTVEFFGDSDRMLAVLITGPSGSVYVFELIQGERDIFPLSEGDGEYTVGVYEHLEDDEFGQVLIVTIDVELIDDIAPFIRANQYVDFCENSRVVEVVNGLTMESDSFFSAVGSILNYVTESIEYNYELAENAEHWYLPDLDSIIDQGEGFCFDIAALMVAMLRSRGIPAKLVVGNYIDIEGRYMYHAWVSVYAEEDGWIGGNIEITGGTWNIIEPTFIARLGMSEALQLVGDGSNYHPEFYY